VQSTFNNRALDEKSGNLTHAFLPGVGAFYALFPNFGLLGGVYRGFSPPAPGSGESIGPELSTNYEAGGRFVEGRARVELIGFYNDYSNLTDVCTFSSGCVNANINRQF